MDRLKGFGSLAAVTVCVMAALRLVHVAVPAVFPETRQGPIEVQDLGQVRALAGFAPILPAYRPAGLGERPVAMTFSYHPYPVFVIIWRQDGQFLSVTQQRGGPVPSHPPLAQALDGIAGSRWWTDGAQSHVLIERGGFWIQIDTTLPTRDLPRLAHTLTPY